MFSILLLAVKGHGELYRPCDVSEYLVLICIKLDINLTEICSYTEQSCYGFSWLFFFPSVLCCTVNAVPETKSLLTKSKLPLGIHLHPFKDLQASFFKSLFFMITCFNKIFVIFSPLVGYCITTWILEF